MIWPWQHRSRQAAQTQAVDDRMDALDERLEQTAHAVEDRTARVDATTTRAERAAARRAAAIAANHFDQLFVHDLRRGRHP